jgi:ABC-type multidrug transport system ATPase subunit
VVYLPYCTGDLLASSSGAALLQTFLNDVIDTLSHSTSRKVTLVATGPTVVGLSAERTWMLTTKLNPTHPNSVAGGGLYTIYDNGYASPLPEASATTTAASLKTFWSLADAHPCATPVSSTNLSPCCLSQTCTASKFPLADANAVLFLQVASTSSSIADTVQTLHDLFYSSPSFAGSVNTILLEENSNLPATLSLSQALLRKDLSTESFALTDAAWFKYNVREYLPSTDLYSHINDFVNDTPLLSSVVIVNSNPITLLPSSVDSNKPRISALHDATDAWLASFVHDTKIDTDARRALAHSRDFGDPAIEAGVSHVASQGLNLINEAEDKQDCLFADQQTLLGLRFLQNTAGGFKPKREQFAEDDAVMHIPKVGTYHGWYDIVEYANINSDELYNNWYHQSLITIQDIDEITNPVTGEKGVHIKQSGISQWSNGSRVSEPWLDHELYFAPCSARTREWTLRFDIQDNINFFVSGMYEFETICAQIQNDCVGEHQQFADYDECLDFYYNLPPVDPQCLEPTFLQGNTTLCRFLHHFMTQSSPDVHCYHVGRGHVADSRGHHRCGSNDCNGHVEPPTAHEIEMETGCPAELQADVEMRALAVLPHCVESVSSQRCMPECRRALNQFGFIGVAPMIAAKRPMQTCNCRDSIMNTPFSALFEETGIDPSQFLRTCGLAGIDPREEDILEASACNADDKTIWVSGIGYPSFLPQQKACSGACLGILGAAASDPVALSNCVAACISNPTQNPATGWVGTPYSSTCSSCFGSLGVCVSSFCSTLCGGAEVSEECSSCAFSNCNTAFTACSSFDASVPPAPPSAIDGLCGGADAWEPCSTGFYRAQPSNECRSVFDRVSNGAGVSSLRRISEYYAVDDAAKANSALQRNVHRLDFDAALTLTTLADSQLTYENMVHRAFNGSDIVPFIDGPFLISHAAVKSAIESNQERLPNAFFWQTDMHADTWGIYGPSQLSTGSDAHGAARDMVFAAWPALSQTGDIELPDVPDVVVDGVTEAGGDFNEIDDDVKFEFIMWIVKATLSELYPGSDVEDKSLSAALGTLGYFSRLSVSPLTYHSLAGLFASDSVGIARGSLGAWIEEYFGEAKMKELCDLRSADNLSVEECAKILGDSTWINTFAPLVGLIMDSFSVISDDIGKHVKLFKSDPEGWLQEQARVTTPVEAIAFVSDAALSASINGKERTYGAKEGAAVAWLSAANKDQAVFAKPYEFDMHRSDSGSAIVFNALRADKDANSGPSLSRVCPANRFALRMATAVIKKMLPGQQDLNALAAGLPLKNNALYEAFTLGGLTIAGSDPTAEASRNAAAALAQSEIAAIVQEMDREQQDCLFTTDATLLSLRAGLFVTSADGGFQAGAKKMLHPDIIMSVPGLGVYYGANDALEYANIMASNDFNGDYHTFLQQYFEMTVPFHKDADGAETEERDYDKLHMVADMVSAWENYTRFSTPIYDNMYDFVPCSTKISKWDLVFQELEDGVNPTFDYFVGGAYENNKLCEFVQRDCTGEHQQFESISECVKFYDSLPEYDEQCLDRENGVGYALQGNTTLCRFLHHFMAHASPQVHCPHVGRGDKADIRGHFKCVPEDCMAHDDAHDEEATCTTEMQADIEMRLVGSLPSCLEALKKGSCSEVKNKNGDVPDTAHCARALRQFGLVGHKRGVENAIQDRLGRAALCSDQITNHPLSITLATTGVDAMDMLRVCSEAVRHDDAMAVINPEGLGYCGISRRQLHEAEPLGHDHRYFMSQKTGNCESYDKVVVKAAPEDVMRAINDYYVSHNSTETHIMNLHLTDVEVVRQLAAFEENDSSSAFLHHDAFMNPQDDVVFVGGNMILSYEGAKAVIFDADQIRDATAFNRQYAQFNAPTAGGPYAPVFLSTKSPLYANSIKAFAKAWPMLGAPQPIVLPKIPDSVKAEKKAGYGALKDLDATSAVASDLATWFIEANLDHLFPKHQGITDSLKAALGVFVTLGNFLTPPTSYHSASGYLGTDGIQVAKALLGGWVKDYYTDHSGYEDGSGQNHMEAIVATYNEGLSASEHLTETEVLNAISDVLWTNTFAAVGRAAFGVAARIADDACLHIDMYHEDPETYVLEHIRLDPPVEQFSFIKADGTRAAVSLSAANRDKEAFDLPDLFNPKRLDLMKQLSWNAVEDDIRFPGSWAEGLPNSIGRKCPAHDYSIAMTIALVDALLPTDENMHVICHDIQDEKVFDFLCMIVNLIGSILGALYIFFYLRASWLRNQLRQHAIEEQILKEEDERNTGALRSSGYGGGLSSQETSSTVGSGATGSKKKRRASVAAQISQEGGLLELRDMEATIEKVKRGGGGTFTAKLLDSVNVSFQPGCLTAVMGGSGAGKSTLLNVASMRQAANISLCGGITFGGEKVETPEDMAHFVRAVGFVPQELDVVVDEKLSCAENLYFQAHLRWNAKTLQTVHDAHGERTGDQSSRDAFGGDDPTAVKATVSAICHAVTDMLDRFGLLVHANTVAKNLSGGQRRRLAIAIECLRPAPVMFLDEPTTGQDSATALGLVGLLKDLAKGCAVLKPKTIVMVIHQPREEIFAMVDRVVLMGRGGRVVYNGPTSEALSQLVIDATGHSPLEEEQPGGILAVGNHTNNLADKLMDILQALTEEQILHAAELVRSREMEHNMSRKEFRKMMGGSKNSLRWSLNSGISSGGSNAALDSEKDDSETAIAPRFHRINALFLKRYWGVTVGEHLGELVFIPFVLWCICALPNWWRGGQPEAQELIVQVLLSWMGPMTMVIGTFYADLPSWMRFLRWQQHSCVLSGSEAFSDVLVGFVGFGCLFQFIVTTLLLTSGLRQIYDFQMLFRVCAFMNGTCMFTVLTIVVGFSAVVRSDIGTANEAEVKCQFARFFSLLYLSFGSTFGGLLYGIEKIPTMFQIMSYASTGFWSNTGVLIVVLRNQDLPCNELLVGEDEEENVTGAACGVSGNVILTSLGLSERWYLPTYGLVFLVVGSLVFLGLLLLLLARVGRKNLDMKHDESKYLLKMQMAHSLKKGPGSSKKLFGNISGSLGSFGNHHGHEKDVRKKSKQLSMNSDWVLEGVKEGSERSSEMSARFSDEDGGAMEMTAVTRNNPLHAAPKSKERPSSSSSNLQRHNTERSNSGVGGKHLPGKGHELKGHAVRTSEKAVGDLPRGERSVVEKKSFSETAL